MRSGARECRRSTVSDQNKIYVAIETWRNRPMARRTSTGIGNLLTASSAMACVDVIVTSFHSVVTQSVFDKTLFECEQVDGDPIVFIKMATNLQSLILRKRLGIKTTFGRAEHWRLAEQELRGADGRMSLSPI
jgi:hypothetical protein